MSIDATATVDALLRAWNEPDPVRRGALIADCWSDPDGQDAAAALDALIVATRRQHPDHVFVRTTDVAVRHDAFRVGWELRGPDGRVALAGVDHGHLAADGRVCRLSGFFSDLPAREEGEQSGPPTEQARGGGGVPPQPP